jgi:hypothetical protein
MQQAFNHIQRAYFIQQQKLSEAIYYEVSKNKILKLISITKGRFPNAYSFHTSLKTFIREPLTTGRQYCAIFMLYSNNLGAANSVAFSHSQGHFLICTHSAPPLMARLTPAEQVH